MSGVWKKSFELEVDSLKGFSTLYQKSDFDGILEGFSNFSNFDGPNGGGFFAGYLGLWKISAELEVDSVKNGLFGRVFHTLYHKSGHSGILNGFYRLFKLVQGTRGLSWCYKNHPN